MGAGIRLAGCRGGELEDGGGGDGDELADPKARWEERPGSEMLIEDWTQHTSGGEADHTRSIQPWRSRRWSATSAAVLKARWQMSHVGGVEAGRRVPGQRLVCGAR